MKFTGNITISRDNHDVINIRLQDKCSRTEFVNVQMTLEDFTLAITGFAKVRVVGEVGGLETLGKIRVNESRSVVYPGNTFEDRGRQEAFIMNNCQEEGWTVQATLGSQGSVKTVEGNTVLTYSVVKYVAPEDSPIDDHWGK